MADVLDLRKEGLASGALAVLRDRTAAAFGSRIESVDSRSVTVVRPTGVPAADPYRPGSVFDVLWTDGAGLHVLPTELAAARIENRVRLWDLAVIGQPWIEQRREFVRVPTFGRIVVTLSPEAAAATDGPQAAATDGPPTAPLTGYLIDFSEVALQANLFAEPSRAGGGALSDPTAINPEPGRRVRCEFTAHGTDFRRGGTIHAVRANPDTGDLLVVIQFDQQDESDAKALRREVFAAQVDMRRVLREQA